MCARLLINHQFTVKGWAYSGQCKMKPQDCRNKEPTYVMPEQCSLSLSGGEHVTGSGRKKTVTLKKGDSCKVKLWITHNQRDVCGVSSFIVQTGTKVSLCAKVMTDLRHFPPHCTLISRQKKRYFSQFLHCLVVACMRTIKSATSSLYCLP